MRNRLNLGHIRALAIALVGTFHVAVFWALAVKSFDVPAATPYSELKVTLFDTAPPIPQMKSVRVAPDFKAPEAVVVPEPDIIVDESETVGVIAKPLLIKIPPQPDITSPHDLPTLPEQYRAWARKASLMLRIEISPDGSIGEADVTRSSGMHDVDDFVCSFVRDNWHYLPATVSGVPVEDWMTVVVRFAA